MSATKSRTDDSGIREILEGGQWRKLNAAPPDAAASQLLQTYPTATDSVPIIPETKWPQYATLWRARIEDYTDQFWLDQGSVGSCAWECVATLVMLARIRAGLPHVLLNPWTGYAQTNRRDVGSDIANNATVAREAGLVPDTFWPRAEHRWQTLPQEWETLAEPYRIQEVFRVRNWLELGSCLSSGIPVGIGVWWKGGGGHAIAAVRMMPDGGVLIKNSWSKTWNGGWDKPGYAILPRRQVEQGLADFSALAVRTVIISE